MVEVRLASRGNTIRLGEVKGIDLRAPPQRGILLPMETDQGFLLWLLAVVVVLPLVVGWFVVRWYRRPHHSRWTLYLFFWPLAALGAFTCLGLAQQEIAARRPALGTGVVVFGFIPALYRWVKPHIVKRYRHWSAFPPR
ncbi:MAG: hypothetical protein NTY02_09255 [Acidobacteria bacterium]|nr:hypothetical protein [Acidobacteriota bacterium]